jgi:hypothetical protein
MADVAAIKVCMGRSSPDISSIHAVSMDIWRYWKNHMWISKAGSIPNTIAAIINLLARGLTIKGVVMFPVVPWAKHLSPTETGYGCIATLQCRAMSAACRVIKKNMITDAGTPNMAGIFPVSPATIAWRR